SVTGLVVPGMTSAGAPSAPDSVAASVLTAEVAASLGLPVGSSAATATPAVAVPTAPERAVALALPAGPLVPERGLTPAAAERPARGPLGLVSALVARLLGNTPAVAPAPDGPAPLAMPLRQAGSRAEGEGLAATDAAEADLPTLTAQPVLQRTPAGLSAAGVPTAPAGIAATAAISASTAASALSSPVVPALPSADNGLATTPSVVPTVPATVDSLPAPPVLPSSMAADVTLPAGAPVAAVEAAPAGVAAATGTPTDSGAAAYTATAGASGLPESAAVAAAGVGGLPESAAVAAALQAGSLTLVVDPVTGLPSLVTAEAAAGLPNFAMTAGPASSGAAYASSSVAASGADAGDSAYAADTGTAAEDSGGWNVADAVWQAHAPLVRQAVGAEALPAGLWQRVWGSLNGILRPAGLGASYAVPMDGPGAWADGPTLTYVSRRVAGTASAEAGADYADAAGAGGGMDYAGAAYSGPSYAGAAYSGPRYAGVAYSGPSYAGAAYSGPRYAGAAYSNPSYAGAPANDAGYAGAAYSGPHYAAAPYSGPSYAGAVYSSPNYADAAYRGPSSVGAVSNMAASAGAAYAGPSYAGANYSGGYSGPSYSRPGYAGAGFMGWSGVSDYNGMGYSGADYSGAAYAPAAWPIGRSPAISPALTAAMRVFASHSQPMSNGMSLLEMAPALAAYFGGAADDGEAGGFDPGDSTTWAAALDQFYGAAQGGALPLAIPWGGQPAVPGAVDPDQQAIQMLAAEWAPGALDNGAAGTAGYAAPGGYWTEGSAPPSTRPRDLTPAWITAYLPNLAAGAAPPTGRSATQRMIFKSPAGGGSPVAVSGSSYAASGYDGAGYEGSSYDGAGDAGPSSLPGYALSAGGPGYAPLSGHGYAPSSGHGYAPPPPRSAAPVPTGDHNSPVADMFWQADGYEADSETSGWAEVVAAAVSNGYSSAQAALALSGEETTPPSTAPAGPALQTESANAEVEQLADAVYDLISRRLRVERERQWD
ncbi:MAG: hypothetical protein M3Z04_01705, partial [Chloroflexota bacterium]|nr:hypothetical protein [Chloroflexota bacterium]